MIKKILKTKYFIIILLSTLSILCKFYIFYPGPLKHNKILIIKPKLSINKIIIILYNNNIIRYPILFKCIVRILALKYTMKSGEYLFFKNISPIQILKTLMHGKFIIHKITIPEGMLVHEIINKINNEKKLIGEIKKTTIPEGSLMPSTYFFIYGECKSKIINEMQKLMTKNLDRAIKKLSINSPLKTRLDILILASIIEKETSLDFEKPLIAAVFLNRINKRMKLQADPTTIYAITLGKKKFTRNLTKKDLVKKSYYNTYYIFNLPPGPICCPGIKSIEATINPSKSNALYFVVNGVGRHHFSNNLHDHNKYAKIHRKILKKH